MNKNKQYRIPNPILDQREKASLSSLTKRYNQLLEPGMLAELGTKVVEKLPDRIKDVGNDWRKNLSEKELYIQATKVIADSFNLIEEQAAKYSLSEEAILEKANKYLPDACLSQIGELCFVRSYELAELVQVYKNQDTFFALLEGGVTGAFGFAGLPFNLVLSTFLYYRAAQSVAMFYGYDVKRDAAELVIAGDVFITALYPGRNDGNELSSIIGKVMEMEEAEAVKQDTQKTWEGMAAARSGTALLLIQMKALASKSAQDALAKAGVKSLEQRLFGKVFEQIGHHLTLEMLRGAIPMVTAAFRALYDTARMKKVLEFADVFYNKRYILEKEMRINAFLK